MVMNTLYRLYPMLVGFLLGLLQTGLFFQLTFTLSSGFGTYLLVILCWLAGSALGVFYIARAVRLPLQTFLVLALLGYALCGLLLAAAPFETGLWPLYAALIMLTALYPGVFFARMAPIFRARVLFLMENTGFILGLVFGTIAFMLLGRLALWVAPLMIEGMIAFMREPGSAQSPAIP